jgi:hypothetical protein
MAIRDGTTAKMPASSSRAAATTKGVVARQPVMSASVYKSMAGAGVTRSGVGMDMGVGVRRSVVVSARREVGGGDDLVLVLGEEDVVEEDFRFDVWFLARAYGVWCQGTIQINKQHPMNGTRRGWDTY